MIKYCFILDEEKGLVQLGAGCSDEYYIEIGMQQRDVQQSDKDFQWYLKEKCPMKTEEEKQQEAEEKRLNMSLTPADVERALYKAKGMDFTDLKELIATTATGIDLKALNIEFNASMFYRGAPFGNGRLFDVVGNLLGYTPADIDYLFENKELPDENTANNN